MNLKLYLLAVTATACSSPKDQPAIDASVSIDAPAQIDAPNLARNAKAVGAWTVASDVNGCFAFDEGFVGTALTNDNEFLLVFNEKFPDNSSPQTTCTFTTDTAFTCENISKQSNLGACIVSGGLDNFEGTITGTAFEIAVDGSSYASAQCPGGARSCGPAVSSATGTIAP